ncbi:hypothetical protein MASR2M17_18900 [Aminivibrio sp.]
MEVVIRWATTTRGTRMVAKMTMADERPRAAPMGGSVRRMAMKKKRRSQRVRSVMPRPSPQDIRQFVGRDEQHCAGSRGWEMYT